MKFISSNINYPAIAAILAVASFSATNALADSIEWSGATSTQFNTGANWVGGVRPGAADIGTFSAMSYPNQPGYTTDAATQSIGGFSFGDGVNPSGAVTFNINNTNFNIGASGVVINPFAGAVTITTASANRLRADGNQTWTNNSSNNLTVSGGSWSSGASGPSTLTLAGTGNFVFNSLGRDYFGNVNNRLSITVSTTGTVSLNAANIYTGTTTITAGTLVLGSGGSFSNTPTITVGALGTLNVAAKSGFALAAGQTLAGTGKIVGNISIGSGTLAIGSSPGTMTFDNNLNFTLDSIANFEVNGFSLGEYDLALGGSGIQGVSFNGALNIAFQSGFSTIGSVKLFDFESYSGSFVNVNFSGLAAGYSASFDGGTGMVSVIPEPSTWALFAGSLMVLTIWRRRRRA